ncbi:hypothetical protein [Vulcanisaeta sp. JCM 14467]|uniref:hypothetical protein n=1 Tax=Vulcanisaeta sp. JCM 14467 TaxID=1295370 RepID=UPI000B06CF1C|nr:hypothetical protein [Vulcanisaeta sp. JCM 14467]
MVDGVIEARDYVAQLISKGWFRHAVGERGVRYIVELLRFVDLNYRECSVNLDLNFLMNLLDDYYNMESRIRYFIREIMRVQGYDSVARQLINATQYYRLTLGSSWTTSLSHCPQTPHLGP